MLALPLGVLLVYLGLATLLTLAIGVFGTVDAAASIGTQRWASYRGPSQESGGPLVLDLKHNPELLPALERQDGRKRYHRRADQKPGRSVQPAALEQDASQPEQRRRNPEGEGRRRPQDGKQSEPGRVVRDLPREEDNEADYQRKIARRVPPPLRRGGARSSPRSSRTGRSAHFLRDPTHPPLIVCPRARPSRSFSSCSGP